MSGHGQAAVEYRTSMAPTRAHQVTPERPQAEVPNLLDQLQSALGSAYRLERELGGGGMSRIFVATETALRRRVVIKVLRPELAAEVDAERFHREIHLAARLQHPHLVPVHSAGEAHGLLYYTMPFVEGESLRHRLEREGPLPVRDVVRILREVTDALSYAHRKGVIQVVPSAIFLIVPRTILPELVLGSRLTCVADLNDAAGRTGMTAVLPLSYRSQRKRASSSSASYSFGRSIGSQSRQVSRNFL